MKYNKTRCLPYYPNSGQLVNEDKYHRLLGRTYDLLCLLNDDRKLTELPNYPKINAHNRNSLFEKAKIYINAEKNKLKYIVNEKSLIDSNQEHIFVFYLTLRLQI